MPAAPELRWFPSPAPACSPATRSAETTLPVGQANVKMGRGSNLGIAPGALKDDHRNRALAPTLILAKKWPARGHLRHQPISL